MAPVAHEVAVEEPLEIRVAGEGVASTMRTPGDDRFLALGFLFAEGVIHELADVGSVFHCGRIDAPGYGNAVDVLPGPGVCLDPERLQQARRRGVISSACGMCGRESIEELLARTSPVVGNEERLAPALIASGPRLLALGQPNFSRTGGMHAACAITAEGRVLETAEDVGRHNAADKVLGKLLYRNALPRQSTQGAQACMLMVSGRASCELVQKAAMGGFPFLVSVSATTSLAIQTAEALGITLIAFAREGRFTVYTHPERVSVP
jgi:FdhD protein